MFSSAARRFFEAAAGGGGEEGLDVEKLQEITVGGRYVRRGWF